MHTRWIVAALAAMFVSQPLFADDVAWKPLPEALEVAKHQRQMTFV